jgi:LysM repeat protein
VWLYQVQQGDSVSGIAIRYGTTTEELLDLNPEYRENENLISAGAQVIVPCTPIAEAEDRC